MFTVVAAAAAATTTTTTSTTMTSTLGDLPRPSDDTVAHEFELTTAVLLIVLLLFLSAVTSGLNLGLLSLDMNELAVIQSCGSRREKSYAKSIAPLRRRGNFLLCALLLGNVLVNSTLTVLLESMTSGLIAIVGSTLAIVVLGEIVPQAICARKGLAIGANTIYLTYSFMILTFPLSYPISKMLDFVLGEEKAHAYDRERLMEFIKITGHHTQLGEDEIAIIAGALKLKTIKVGAIMTRIDDVFMLPIECKLDRDTIKRIIVQGYSRIPIYDFGDRKQIVALVLAKDLALIDPDDDTPIAHMLLYCKHPLVFIDDDVTLDVALDEFKRGKSHMAVVRRIVDDGETDKYYEAIGVVTLEDVIEEVLQSEINDETDCVSDNRKKRRRLDAQLAYFEDEQTQLQLELYKVQNPLKTAAGEYLVASRDHKAPGATILDMRPTPTPAPGERDEDAEPPDGHQRTPDGSVESAAELRNAMPATPKQLGSPSAKSLAETIFVTAAAAAAKSPASTAAVRSG